MLNLKKLFADRTFRYSFIAVVSVLLVYVILRIIYYPDNPVASWLSPVFETYLLFPEWISNLIFRSTDAGVMIRDHALIYDHASSYSIEYERFITHWPKYLLYKRWSALILVLIWGTVSPLRRKLRFSTIFLLTHIVSVVGGLYLMGVIGPRLIDEQTSYFMTPTLVGTFLMYIFLIAWVMLNKKEIRNSFQKFSIVISISDRKINEILVILFFFLLIRNYLIPFIDYKPYVYFLLESTRRVAAIFGYTGHIVGPALIGDYGAVALSKHCLGFMTMYIFAALVYLTRLNENRKASWIFIASGLVFLLILNIIRMLLIFIIAQGENGFEKASKHHEVYNVVIYIFIFALWVVWYEFFILKARKKRIKFGE